MAGHALLNLREARPRDCAAILGFIRELAGYEKLLHEVVADQAGIRETLFGEAPSANVLIAELGETPVGFALYHSMYSTFIGRPGIYLEDLYVQPAQRGRGIGKALLVRLAEIAVARGCCRLDWSVLDWNKPAIGFYQSIGAYPLSEWTRFRLDGEALAAMAER
jgi:ribosomal protein S18 acetylase RimI-like enzyme